MNVGNVKIFLGLLKGTFVYRRPLLVHLLSNLRVFSYNCNQMDNAHLIFKKKNSSFMNKMDIVHLIF